MKKIVSIVSIIAIAAMVIPMFAANTLAVQPPIVTSTFYEGTIGWGPGRADPARIYDTGSGQLAFNVYETLIAWDHESYYTFRPVLATEIPDRETEVITISNTSAVPEDVYGATWDDGYTSKGYYDLSANLPGFSTGDVIYMEKDGIYRTWLVQNMVGTYTLTLWRGWYTFHMRTDPVIYFYNESGLPIDTFDINDAVYSFKRGLCQDNGPQWMYYKAFFGTMTGWQWNSTSTAEMNVWDLANLINSAVEASGNDLTLNLGMTFPDNAFKQTLSNTWGSIVSEQFCKSIGCWNGELFTDSDTSGWPDWWGPLTPAEPAWVHTRSRSPLDQTGSMRWAGTGPYYVGVFDQPNLKIDLLRNDAYWGGWPAAGRNDSVAIYEIQYIAEWATRKTAFLAGDLDVCAVPRANMFELLQAPSTNAEPILTDGKPVIKTIKNIVPQIAMDALHFTFRVTLPNTNIGSGHFPDGIPADFFNNTNVRRAFAWSFNATQYGVESYYGEADYRKSPLAAGLFPDYYDDTLVPGYTASYENARTALQAATFPDLVGNVYDSGFELNIIYNTGNDMRRIFCEMIRDFFVTLSGFEGRTGNPFTVNVLPVDWSVYEGQFQNQELPLWSIGWLADFADAENFMRPYMDSAGDFSGFQGYSNPTVDALLNQALLTPDGPARQALYNQLAVIYYNDAISLPITCPRGRRWTQYWAKGWYYDALYPAFYARDIYKMNDCWYDITGPTKYVSDGTCNMRDINYLIAAFNAKAPKPGEPADIRWNGNYGANGGVDPSGDRLSNMRDIQGAILHFNHKLDADPIQP